MAAPLRQFRLDNALVCAGIGLAGAVVVWALKYAGVLQSAELYAYDLFVTRRAPAISATNDQIVMVEETEQDIETYDYPVTDAMLATLFTKIEQQQPSAIGLDLYRDLLEPRNNRTGIEMLDSVLKDNSNIVCAYRYGNRNHPFEIPPPRLPPEEMDYRAGFSNFPNDDKSVRRAFLYVGNHNSFALLLARFKGVALGPGENGQVRIGGVTVHRFTANTGGYLNASAGGYQFLLDFKGGTNFSHYSLEQVFDGKVPANAFTDKIVLIGETAASVKDAITTPVNNQEPGVELHGLVVDQLMRMQRKGDQVTQAWGETAQAAWLLLWCAIAANIGYYCRAPNVFLTAPVAMVALLIFCCWRAFLADWWIPLIPPLAGSLPVAALVISYMGYRERKDLGTLMDILGRHVSKGVAQTIWKERDSFTQDRRLVPMSLTATILFTDLQNFSTVSEGMSPKQLLDWINEYMEKLVCHIEQCDGMVNKYMGDSIMAVFGAPVPSTTPEKIKRDALNAVKCALAMGRELDQLNLTRQAENRPTTNMRVGIYTGEAVSGSIGSCQRLEFTVLGDTVNTASRLESFDKSLFADQSCRILLGETTRDLVKSHFHLQFIDTIELKGQHEKTDIYYLPRDADCQECNFDRCPDGTAAGGNVLGAGLRAGGDANANLPSAGYR